MAKDTDILRTSYRMTDIFKTSKYTLAPGTFGYLHLEMQKAKPKTDYVLRNIAKPISYTQIREQFISAFKPFVAIMDCMVSGLTGKELCLLECLRVIVDGRMDMGHMKIMKALAFLKRHQEYK
ncbi:hypothetical protein LOTGIDRAFT_160971 [Lottia gigantea]|uniref:Uncharacterized protein n=1 Tax=Lottia gigantea TaxID=225164 RepID=V4AD06_LOTGI|nr:hypothetical protein LOTGIDRAFT_160971 [Lottia gigantea]ESO94737.1 hypothetical protein LOTGIDRAFT_160971 [Lottia gigantea]